MIDPAIGIPELPNLLIIGASDTSIEFSIYLQEVAQFNRVYHMETINQAIRLLSDHHFSVAVIDLDSNIEPISCSRMLKVNNSHIRIVMISHGLDATDKILDYKNKGVIHAFLPIPSDEIMAHTMIIQEDSKYQINRSLEQTMRTSQQVLMRKPVGDAEFKLLGLTIIESTVVKFNIIFDHRFEIEPYLLSTFLSAFASAAKYAISEGEGMRMINLDEYSILFHQIDDIQFIYYVKFDRQQYDETVSRTVIKLTEKIFHRYKKDLLRTNIPSKVERAIYQEVIETLPTLGRARAHTKENNPVVFGVAGIFREYSEVTELTSSVYDYLDVELAGLQGLSDTMDPEVIMVKLNSQTVSHVISHLADLKDSQPDVQVIAKVDQPSSELLFRILNADSIDFVTDPSFSSEEILRILKAAIDRSRSISSGIISGGTQVELRTRNRAEIIRALLRDKGDLQGDISSHYHSLIIIRANVVFHQETFESESDQDLLADPTLFVGFINSLRQFSSELMNSPVLYSGLKYGNYQILIEQIFDFTFVFFMSNLTQRNYQQVQGKINTFSHELFDNILTSMGSDPWEPTPYFQQIYQDFLINLLS